LWRGKERVTRWIEIRRVAKAAIDDALTAVFLNELIAIVKGPCRDAGLKAYRDRRDESAQLKREYYNMVMDLLEGENWEGSCMQGGSSTDKFW
jgi:hypothetical protein